MRGLYLYIHMRYHLHIIHNYNSTRKRTIRFFWNSGLMHCRFYALQKVQQILYILGKYFKIFLPKQTWGKYILTYFILIISLILYINYFYLYNYKGLYSYNLYEVNIIVSVNHEMFSIDNLVPFNAEPLTGELQFKFETLLDDFLILLRFYIVNAIILSIYLGKNLYIIFTFISNEALDYFTSCNMFFTQPLPIYFYCIIIYLFLLWKVYISKSTNKFLIWLLLILIFLNLFLIEKGPEPLVYFFFLTEISGFFILFLITVEKKQKFINKKYMNFITFYFIFILLNLSTRIDTNSYYFNFYQNLNIKINNDFLNILYLLYFQNNYIVLILFIIYLYSIIYIIVFNKKSSKIKKNINKFNFNIFKKLFLKKWFK